MLARYKEGEKEKTTEADGIRPNGGIQVWVKLSETKEFERRRTD
jgi:hypothetical protein